MKLLIPVAVILGLIGGYSAWSAWQDYKWGRQVSYYSFIFPKGTTRRTVEGYLDARGTRHRRDYRCLTDVCDALNEPPLEDGPADLVVIGDLGGTIVCAPGNVYAAFEFKSRGAKFTTEPSPEDLLKLVIVYKLSGGCM